MIITSSTLGELEPRRTKFTVSCEANPGFQATVYPNGTITFASRWKESGKSKRQSLGADFNLAQELHRTLRAQRGSNPTPSVLPEPVREAVDLIRGPDHDLFRQGHNWVSLSELWLSEYVQKELTIMTYKNYALHIRRVTEAGALPEGVTLQHARMNLKALLLKVARRTPVQANRMRKCLSSLFKWASVWDYVADTPVHDLPCFPESKAKERRLNDAELSRLLPYLDQSEMDRDKRDALKLQLLTGLRSGEVLGLRWSWVDYPGRRIRIPSTKNGRPFVVALSEPAADLVWSMARRSGMDRLTTATTWGLRQALHRACASVDIPKAGPHDLRRTCATLCGQLGVPMEVIGRVLNHTAPGVTAKHYALYEFEAEKREALQAVAGHLQGLGMRV